MQRLPNFRQIASLMTISLLMGACTVGPDFEKPKTDVPKTWDWVSKPSNNAQTLASTVSLQSIDVEWWKQFNDPELTKLVNRAMGANLSIRQAATRMEQSRAHQGIALADQFPRLNGNASYSHQKPSEKGVIAVFGGSSTAAGAAAKGTGIGVLGIPAVNIQPFDLWQYGFDASWELDLWGRVRRGIEYADASFEASNEAKSYAMLSTLAEVARDYIELRRIQRTLEIIRQMEDYAQQHLELATQKVENGVATDLDVSQAKTQLASIQAQIPQVEEQQSEMINRLSFLVSAPPKALQAELIQPAIVPPVPPRIPIGLPSDLVRRRPDIRQAEAQLHAATAEIGVAVADFYPRFLLTGSAGLQGLKIKDLANWQALQYAIGPSMTLPIFQGGRLKATLELRESEQKEAAIAYQNTVLQAWHEIDNALTAYANEQLRNDRLAEAVKSSQDELELATMRFKHGVTDFLPVLTAQKTRLQSELDYANSTGKISTNLVALYKALGGGFDPATEIVTKESK
jgi:NodT family efflux transporter outer membrane factor (OMF) lipoprotein